MPFQNRALEKLFRGVLQSESVQFEADLTPKSAIDEAISSLPLTLSEAQKDALYNAWQHEISYVQGPPGTGKSYTIVAIMIAAILMGKKVLFVAQKQPAIEVVRRKIADLLGENAIVYVGSDSQERQQLQSFLANAIADVSRHDFSDRLRRKEQELTLMGQEIQRLAHEVDRYTQTLKDGLEAEQNYYQANQRFVQKRQDFAEIYDAVYTQMLVIREDVFERERYQNNIAKIQAKIESGRLRRKDVLHLKRFYRYCMMTLNADRQKFSASGLSSLPTYLDRLLGLTLHFSQVCELRRQIRSDLNQVRMIIQQSEAQLLKQRKAYVKRKCEFEFLRSLQQHRASADGFRKLLKWANPNRIEDAMKRVDYRSLTQVFPLWAGKIQDIGRFLPFASELFDLVIVDEASQVNIAEIVPAFYRGRSFCVVGDDKQLGLNASGLFALNRQFERLMWNKCFSGVNRVVSYDKALEKKLIVSQCSILDLILCDDHLFSIPKVRLNEHFRSLPQLARFTSEQFYDGELLIMTEVGQNVQKSCFEAIQVDGQRNQGSKVVQAEIDQALEILHHLIRRNSYLQAPLAQHQFTGKPTVGLLCFVTDQRKELEQQIQDRFSEEELQAHQVRVGTPEEFQGNERNIMILTLGLDLSGRFAKGFYENPNRFNVATSRAIHYTYFVYVGIPKTAKLLKDYLRHFGCRIHELDGTQNDLAIEQTENILDSRISWRFNESNIESEFEHRVAEYLREFIQQNGGDSRLVLYNQVESCKKRLDFVLLSTHNHDCCAIEVDGQHHFSEDGRSYSEAHLARVAILERAGWKIIHVPYHKWYQKGWLCDRQDVQFQATLNSLYAQIKAALELG
jgi:KaiC/GvpD/RAD55 family RecA-like ATPase